MASLSSRVTKVERKLTAVVRTQRAQGEKVRGLSTRLSRLDSARKALGLPAPRSNPKAKYRVGKISLDRSEGPARETGKRTTRSFAEAQKIINEWSRSAPRTGGYDKVDFTVRYLNGQSFSGRLDIKHPSVANDNDLAEHMLFALRRHSDQKGAAAFLRDYQIGEDERSNPRTPFPEDRFPGLEQSVQAGAARQSNAWWNYGTKKEQKHRREYMAKQGIYPPGTKTKRR